MQTQIFLVTCYYSYISNIANTNIPGYLLLLLHLEHCKHKYSCLFAIIHQYLTLQTQIFLVTCYYSYISNIANTNIPGYFLLLLHLEHCKHKYSCLLAIIHQSLKLQTQIFLLTCYYSSVSNIANTNIPGYLLLLLHL